MFAMLGCSRVTGRLTPCRIKITQYAALLALTLAATSIVTYLVLPSLMEKPDGLAGFGKFREMQRASNAISSRRLKEERRVITPKEPLENKCEEQSNIVFIKVHKAGGGVVANILQRFGDRRNLTFVLPREDNTENTGWPYCFQSEHMLPSKTGRYNILCNHAVYNPRVMNQIMPKDTPYVTILRNPQHQFEALFEHYRFARTLGLHGADPLADFLEKPREYVSRFHSASAHRFLLQNPMTYDLGLDPENFGDEGALLELIADLESNFRLVMMTEYMDESLVLLKERMCWSDVDDIIYYRPHLEQQLLSGQQRHRDSAQSAALGRKLRRWNAADHVLYQHFNKTFWRRVRDYGPRFQQDLEELRARNRAVGEFCRQHRWGGPPQDRPVAAPFDPSLCTMLGTTVSEYTQLLRDRSDHYIRNEL